MKCPAVAYETGGESTASSLPTQKCACEDWGKGKGNWVWDLNPLPISPFPLPRFRHESELLATSFLTLDKRKAGGRRKRYKACPLWAKKLKTFFALAK
ncbi:hypothetical protein N0Y54_41405, partial [Nostoc punctiforme UO1]|uniref:hypothetical protein n=1 Tax=Nostoc punctiforme TaxID=272131 RepID=UPI00309ED659